LLKDIGYENKNAIITINQKALNMQDRIAPPAGFCRMKENENSIATYMRKLLLKEWDSAVKYYNGSLNLKPNVYCAVIDLPIGNKDLHQCADAVIN